MSLGTEDKLGVEDGTVLGKSLGMEDGTALGGGRVKRRGSDTKVK